MSSHHRRYFSVNSVSLPLPLLSRSVREPLAHFLADGFAVSLNVLQVVMERVRTSNHGFILGSTALDEGLGTGTVRHGIFDGVEGNHRVGELFNHAGFV